MVNNPIQLTEAEAKYVKEVFQYTTNLYELPLSHTIVFFENAEEGFELDISICQKILEVMGLKGIMDNHFNLIMQKKKSKI